MKLRSVQVISTAVLVLWTLTSVFDVSSSEHVPVCSGGQINLTCQATPNETLLQWSLSLPDRSHPEIRYISSRGNAQSVTPLTVGRTVFQFFRTSTSPLDLTSEIVISNVSVELNGTRVACSSGGSLMSVTFISVIKNVNSGAPLTPSDDRITTIDLQLHILEGSMLELSCRNVATAVCCPDGIWIPDPNMHTCKSLTYDSSENLSPQR